MVTASFSRLDSSPRRLRINVKRLPRVQREELVVARAEADIDAGLGIDHDDIEGWLDALERGENGPLPASRNEGHAPA